MKDFRRSWHCRRLFFRYLRQKDKEKQATKELYSQNVALNSEDTKNQLATTSNPMSRKALLIVCGVITVIIVGIVLLIAFASPKYTHKCVFSNYGTSTSTCQHIGETTYKCIYADNKEIKCKKTKIVPDIAYAPCKYQVKSTIYEKINQSKYLSACAYCGKEKEEIVNHSSWQYKDKIGNWGIIGVNKNDVVKKSSEYVFECLMFTQEKIKYAQDTDYYIVLKLYDLQENLYATYYMRGHILTTKMYSHSFKIRDYTHRIAYYDHRWELEALEPNNGIKLSR